MLGKVAVTFFFLSLSSFALGNILKWGHKQPSPLCDLINSRPVPYKTNSPINVNTKNATKVKSFIPLTLRNALFAFLVVRNSGNFLEVLGNPVAPDTGATFGGILCGRLYIFYKVEFYCNPSLGRSYHKIDGEGAPLTARLIYFKAEYKTFEEALKHRDGIVCEDFLIKLSHVDNILFYPVQLVLFFLRKAGSFIALPAGLIYAWFDRLPFIHEYLAFLGSYTNPITGEQYQSVINVVAKKILIGISERQFLSSFASLLRYDGTQQNSTQPLNALNGRKIYEGQELAQDLSLF